MSGRIERASKWASGHVPLRTLAVAPPRPVLSVTFDDVIASAALTGAEVLAEAGVRGTFYVAGGLTGGVEQGHETHQIGDLERLHHQGHQLGCHGWSHQRFSSLTTRELTDELDRNTRLLRGITGSAAPIDFAYPLGDHSMRTKLLARRSRASLRVTGGGVHRGRVDPDCLGSHRLYGPGAEEASWQGFLDSLAGQGGWGIVNSHAVSDEPGPFGVSPQTLRRFLGRAQDHGCVIVPVRAALEGFAKARR